MEYCPHCMRPATGAVCTSCGGNINWTAAPGQLPMGTLLQGSDGHTYQIGAARGQGGFGITYAALDLTTNGRVAIKEYFPTRCAQRNQVNQVIPHTGQTEVYRGGMKSFLEEAMMLSAVGALPSVVTVHDCFEGNGTAYIVMEFVDGMPLHQVVAQKGRMAAAELLPKLPALLQDFAILHKAGVIHRDISPDNLILMPNGALKILDFGSARSLQDGKSMSVLLKEGFSPVEQYMSRGQGPYTDVYALAATLYYCLTGTLPPPAVTRLEQDTLQRPNALGAGLSTEQEEAILCGLIVQPKSRTASMEVFRDRLFPGGAVPKQTVVSGSNASVQKEADPGAVSSFRTESLDTSEEAEKPAEGTGGGTSEVSVETTDSTAEKRRPEKKKLIAIIAAAVAAVLLIGLGVSYAMTHGTTEDGFAYTLKSNDHAIITGYEGEGGDIIIPEQIKDLPVEQIAENAFDDCPNIGSVTVDAGVESLGAFDGCDGITIVAFEGEHLDASWSGELQALENLCCVQFDSQRAFDRSAAELKARLDESVVFAYLGQDTGYGCIEWMEVEDSVVYAMTDRSNAVVLALPEGVAESSLASTQSGCQVILPDGRLAGRNAYYTTAEDGYSYFVDKDLGAVMITDYTGSEDILFMEDEFEDLPITKIGMNAFAGNRTITAVYLPTELEEIESGAFRDCANLGSFGIYGDVSFAADAFSGCTSLRAAVASEGVHVDTSTLPVGFKVYRYGMETEIGPLSIVSVADMGTIYGFTADADAIVLDIADNVTTLDLSATAFGKMTKWVDKDAVSGVSPNAVITLADNMRVDPSICDAAQWQANCTSDAWSWLYSNKVCNAVGAVLGNNFMQVNEKLMKATAIRAQELSQSDSHTRPNGNTWGTVLDSCGVNWSSGTAWKDVFDGNITALSAESLQEIIDSYVEEVRERNITSYNNFAMSAYYDSAADVTYINCIGVIR